MDQTVFNTSSAKEHVTDINRCIRTVKECIRDIVSTLNFHYLRKIIVTNIVYFAVLWVNYFTIKMECIYQKFTASDHGAHQPDLEETL